MDSLELLAVSFLCLMCQRFFSFFSEIVALSLLELPSLISSVPPLLRCAMRRVFCKFPPPPFEHSFFLHIRFILEIYWSLLVFGHRLYCCARHRGCGHGKLLRWRRADPSRFCSEISTGPPPNSITILWTIQVLGGSVAPRSYFLFSSVPIRSMCFIKVPTWEGSANCPFRLLLVMRIHVQPIYDFGGPASGTPFAF